MFVGNSGISKAAFFLVSKLTRPGNSIMAYNHWCPIAILKIMYKNSRSYMVDEFGLENVQPRLPSNTWEAGSCLSLAPFSSLTETGEARSAVGVFLC